MRIGILGSGIVGQTIGAKLVERREDVVLGTRSPAQLGAKRGMAAPLQDWLDKTHDTARIGTFEDAARHGDHDGTRGRDVAADPGATIRRAGHTDVQLQDRTLAEGMKR